MENPILSRLSDQIDSTVANRVIKDRRFLDDEQLIRAEQIDLLEAIFNAKVRDAEIKELTYHFSDIFRGNNPVHLTVWGQTGTGKTLTIQYFLGLLAELCRKRGIPFRYEHLDLSTPRPCFRALNDLACQLKASRRYRQGISLEEMMARIESALANYEGYFVLVVDECDHIRRDTNTFYTFLIRRLPQQIKAKLTLILVSNKIDWPNHLDPRVKSFLRSASLFFMSYNAVDLQQILKIRVDRALHRQAVEEGVIGKIAALSSREHGDARKAVTLLSRSAQLAEKIGSKITLELVDQAAQDLEQDRYILMVRTAPVHLQAAMASIIEAWQAAKSPSVTTGDAYDNYREFCQKAGLQPLTPRAFGDLVSELGIYALVRVRLLSRGRYGRTREISLELPDDLVDKIHETILLNFELR